MVKKHTTAPPASPGTAVIVVDDAGLERPGVIVDTMSEQYLVRFHDGRDRWRRPEQVRGASGRTLYGVTSPPTSEIRRATRSWTPPPRHSQIVEIGNISEHPTCVDLSPPNQETVSAAEKAAQDAKRRRTGRYSYTRGSEPPPAHDKVSVRALDAVLKSEKTPRDR